MADFDAAAALLMLSSGGCASQQAKSGNNYRMAMADKSTLHCGAANIITTTTTTTPHSDKAVMEGLVDLTTSPVSKGTSQSKFVYYAEAKTTTPPPQSASDVLALDLTSSPESKVSSHSELTRGTTPPKLVPITISKEDFVRSRHKSLLRVQRDKLLAKVPPNADAVSSYVAEIAFSPKSESESTMVVEVGGGGRVGGRGRRARGRKSMPYGVVRLGSTSPPDLVHRWDSSRTSSPIVASSSGLLPSPHSSHESYGELRGPTAPVYDSPGMNGFALQLTSKAMTGGRDGKYAVVSSPEPSLLVAPVVSEGERKSRRPYHHHHHDHPPPPASSAGSHVEEKSLNSPTDSGVSSIHDEVILQPKLKVPPWPKGSHLGAGLPVLVRTELKKIVDESTVNKELYTKTQMMNYPLELTFNPNKSRFRKECSNAIDNLDRERNNEASRRSRQKKKLMTQVMSISLEFDRNENRQLYLQERWLNNMIFELEEKALNDGMEAQELRKLRANCGFQ